MRSTVRKALLRRVVLVGASAIAAVSVSDLGCSSPRDGGGGGSVSAPPPGSSGNVGTVGIALTLLGGEVLNTVSWTLTGPNGAATVVQSGSVNVQNSSSISFLVSS